MAKFRPSAGDKWFYCPLYPHLIESIPREAPGPWAEAGIKAAKLLEDYQVRGVFKLEHNHGLSDKDAGALQAYLTTVSAYLWLLNMFPDEVEPEFKTRMYEQDGYIDTRIYEELSGHMVLLDYKNGAGVYVPSVGNKQLAWYGVSELERVGVDNVTTLELGIIQPRCSQWSKESSIWYISDPAAWYEEWKGRIEDARAAAFATPDKGVVGEHCNKFCDIKKAGKCPAHGEAYTALTTDFEVEAVTKKSAPLTAAGLSVEELTQVLEAAPGVEAFIAACRERDLALKLKGEGSATSTKLILTSGKRRWADEAALISALATKDPRGRVKVFTDPLLKSPAQLEKEVGKEFVAKYAETAPGNYKAVPLNHRSKPVAPPVTAEDFETEALDF